VCEAFVLIFLRFKPLCSNGIPVTVIVNCIFGIPVTVIVNCIFLFNSECSFTILQLIGLFLSISPELELAHFSLVQKNFLDSFYLGSFM